MTIGESFFHSSKNPFILTRQFGNEDSYERHRFRKKPAVYPGRIPETYPARSSHCRNFHDYGNCSGRPGSSHPQPAHRAVLRTSKRSAKTSTRKPPWLQVTGAVPASSALPFGAGPDHESPLPRQSYFTRIDFAYSNQQIYSALYLFLVNHSYCDPPSLCTHLGGQGPRGCGDSWRLHLPAK
jgi:hypothetical protein